MIISSSNKRLTSQVKTFGLCHVHFNVEVCYQFGYLAVFVYYLTVFFFKGFYLRCQFCRNKIVHRLPLLSFRGPWASQLRSFISDISNMLCLFLLFSLLKCLLHQFYYNILKTAFVLCKFHYFLVGISLICVLIFYCFFSALSLRFKLFCHLLIFKVKTLG